MKQKYTKLISLIPEPTILPTGYDRFLLKCFKISLPSFDSEFVSFMNSLSEPIQHDISIDLKSKLVVFIDSLIEDKKTLEFKRRLHFNRIRGLISDIQRLDNLVQFDSEISSLFEVLKSLSVFMLNFFLRGVSPQISEEISSVKVDWSKTPKKLHEFSRVLLKYVNVKAEGSVDKKLNDSLVVLSKELRK